MITINIIHVLKLKPDEIYLKKYTSSKINIPPRVFTQNLSLLLFTILRVDKPPNGMGFSTVHNDGNPGITTGTQLTSASNRMQEVYIYGIVYKGKTI